MRPSLRNGNESIYHPMPPNTVTFARINLGIFLAMAVGYVPLVLGSLVALSQGAAVNYPFGQLRVNDVFFCAVGGLALGLVIAKQLITQYGHAAVLKLGAVQMTALLLMCGFVGNDTGEWLALHLALGFTGATTMPTIYLAMLEKRLHLRSTNASSALVCLAGIGVGLFLLPKGVQWMIAFSGWRNASVGLALLFGAINLLVWAFLFRGTELCNDCSSDVMTR